MSAGVIRKEDTAQVDAWEMEAFGPSDHAGVRLPTVDQIDRLHRTAHSEGFEQGYRDGQARAAAEAEKLAALLRNVAAEIDEFDRNIADNVLSFALVVAQAVLRTDLDHRPELIIPVIRESLAEFPTTGHSRQLRLHPQDAAIVKQVASDLVSSGRIEVIEDAAIERGGCRLRSDIGEVDATLPTRWQRALAALGRNDAWLGQTTDEAAHENETDGEDDVTQKQAAEHATVNQPGSEAAENKTVADKNPDQDKSEQGKSGRNKSGRDESAERDDETGG